MQNKIPHFDRCARGDQGKQYGFITVDGEFLHKIENPKEFYEAFGYTFDLAMAGILPDEFIWDEYIKDNPVVYADCLQIHFIGYLKKYSAVFRETYGEQCESWIETHANAAAARGTLCAVCRIKLFCSTTATGKQRFSKNNEAKEKALIPDHNSFPNDVDQLKRDMRIAFKNSAMVLNK